MKRILLVDDDKDMRTIFQELLKDEKFQVDTAENGQQAWDLITKGGYHLILLDIIMPQIDGITLLRKLQYRAPTQPNGPIYMLTVLNQEEFIKSSLKLGATGYLNKATSTPIDIINQIKDILK